MSRGRPKTKEQIIETAVEAFMPASPWEDDIFKSQPTEKEIKAEITNFDVSRLTENQKNYIGSSAGFKIWDSLTTEQKKQAWVFGTTREYFSHSIFNPGNIPPLLCYKRVGKGFKNEYIINLNSMRPTKSSNIQEPVPQSIINYFK